MTEGRTNEPAVPVGVEQVLLLAGVEPRFAEALRDHPEAALGVSGVALSDTERAILRTVPEQRLAQMAERLVATVQEPTRRVFLGQASAALAALASLSGGAAGCGEKSPTAGEGSAVDSMGTMARMRQREIERRHRAVAPTGIRPGPWPHMDAAEPKIEGPIDKKATRRSLLSYSLSVRRCWFSKMPGNHPKGVLRLDLVVDAKGKVSKASLGAGSLKNNDIESCILAAARAWRFTPSKPRPTKISVVYTFSYRY